MLSDDFLLNCFQRGWIPGPEEGKRDFLIRTSGYSSLNYSEWEEVAIRTEKKFGFAIDWVPIIYSNTRWWEGAAILIDPPNLPTILLKKKLSKGTIWGYRRKDILAHEAVHAARMMFQEPFFEEILAYSLLPQSWRRFWGALFSQPWEGMIFLLSSILGWVDPIIPTSFLSCWIGWLLLRQITFKKCCDRFSSLVTLCFTDKEIWKYGWSRKKYQSSQSTAREQLIELLIDLKKSNQIYRD